MTEQSSGTHGPREDDALKREVRSDLARHLDRTAWPATRARLLEVLESHQAEQRLLDLVSTLPESATYASLAELLPALGLPIEERPS